MVNVTGTYLHTYYNQQYLDIASNSASNATPVSKEANNYLREEDFGKSDINTSGQGLLLLFFRQGPGHMPQMHRSL
jgi:hypothetical protein